MFKTFAKKGYDIVAVVILEALGGATLYVGAIAGMLYLVALSTGYFA